MSVVNGRASGSSVRASKSTATNRRARSSETVRPLPVKITKAEALSGTISDRPSTRTRAGRSVIALASRLDLNAVLFRLSRNRAGLPSISSAVIRFSSSSAVAPAVTACGSRPKAMMQMQRASRPLPAPAPDIGAARNSTPGAKCRLGRQTAVSSATRKALSSLPGGLLASTTATPPVAVSTVSASAKQKVLKVSRIRPSAAAASSFVGRSGTHPARSGMFSHHIPVARSYPCVLSIVPSARNSGADAIPFSGGNRHSPRQSRYIVASGSGRRALTSAAGPSARIFTA